MTSRHASSRRPRPNQSLWEVGGPERASQRLRVTFYDEVAATVGLRIASAQTPAFPPASTEKPASIAMMLNETNDWEHWGINE